MSAEIEKRIKTLSSSAKTWETGFHKKANEAHYEILEQCLNYSLEIEGTKKSLKDFKAYLKDLSENSEESFQWQEDSRPLTFILRIVFKYERRTAANYSLGLLHARKEASKVGLPLVDWLLANKGIEGARSKARAEVGNKSILSFGKQIAFGESHLKSLPSIVNIDLQEKLEKLNYPKSRKTGSTLFFARHNEDGTTDLILEVPKRTLIRYVLRKFGRDKAEKSGATNDNDRDEKQKNAVAKAVKNTLKKDSA